MKIADLIVFYLIMILCVFMSNHLCRISKQLDELIKINTPEAINVIDEKFVLEKKI